MEVVKSCWSTSGSATGTAGPSNEATWCDISPNAPPPLCREKVVDVFQRLATEFADAPLRVINTARPRPSRRS